MSTKVYGIDVSYHQGVIDWKKTASELRRVNGGKNSGFAFLRVGRSNLDGKGGLSLDSQWKNNLAGCEANGVPVGVYWYCYDESVAAVMQTAHDVVDQLKGHKFDYPIVFDMEYEPFNTGEETTLPCDGVFISVGRKPATDLVAGQLTLDRSGYIVADETTRTNIPGVYAVGDVRTKPLRQVVTAVTDGATAVHMAEEYLAGGE